MAKEKMKCQDCPHCEYIGDGDYVCMRDVPKLVLTEFNDPTDDYLWCEEET